MFMVATSLMVGSVSLEMSDLAVVSSRYAIAVILDVGGGPGGM